MGRGKGSVETLFSCHSKILCGSYEGDPLSPPQGEAACGEHPLDPPPFLEYYFQPYQGLSQYRGCPSGGGGSTIGWSPKERLIASLRISTKRKTHNDPEGYLSMQVIF